MIRNVDYPITAYRLLQTKHSFHLYRLLKSLKADCILSYFIKPVIYGTICGFFAGIHHRVAMIEGLGSVFSPSQKSEQNTKDRNAFANNDILENNISKHKVDFTAPLPPREVAWEIKDPGSDDYEILGTLGNFSLIKGKAKSKKSLHCEESPFLMQSIYSAFSFIHLLLVDADSVTSILRGPITSSIPRLANCDPVPKATP